MQGHQWSPWQRHNRNTRETVAHRLIKTVRQIARSSVVAVTATQKKDPQNFRANIHEHLAPNAKSSVVAVKATQPKYPRNCRANIHGYIAQNATSSAVAEAATQQAITHTRNADADQRNANDALRICANLNRSEILPSRSTIRMLPVWLIRSL